MRYDPQLGVSSLHRPVTVHMNYHPEKELRMADVNRFYHLNDQTALEKWNGGEGRSTGSCKGKLGVNTERLPSLQPDELSSHTLVKNLLARSEGWVWPGHGTIRFDPSGELRSDEPGVSGASWGTVPSVWRKDSLHVKVRGCFDASPDPHTNWTPASPPFCYIDGQSDLLAHVPL